jgi:hypothetical protein
VNERARRELARVVERAIVARGEQPPGCVARLAREVGPRVAPHRVGKPVLLKDAHGVGIHDDPGADGVELRRPFEDRGSRPAQGELARERKPADAAADNHDLHGLAS